MICEQESEKLRLNVWNIRIDGVDVRVECLKCCSWSDKGNFNIDFSCCSIFNGVLRRLLLEGFLGMVLSVCLFDVLWFIGAGKFGTED